MTSVQENPLNLASVLAALFAVHASPYAAAALGAYAAIILAAVAGSGWALTRSTKPRTGGKAALFVVLLVATSTVVTVGVAEMVHSYWQSVSSTDLVAPLALAISAVGDDWPRLVRGTLRVLVRWRLGVNPKGGS